MVTFDEKNCPEPNALLNKSALTDSLRLLFKAMLMVIATLLRLGATGFTATADRIDEKIADTLAVRSGPSAARPNNAVDEDDIKVQSGLAAPSPNGSAAEISKDNSERAELQAQLDALLAEKRAMELAKAELCHLAARAGAHAEADRQEKIAAAAAMATTASTAHAVAAPMQHELRPTPLTTGTVAVSVGNVEPLGQPILPAPDCTIAGTSLALVDVLGPFLDEQGVYNELAHTGQKVYAGVVTDGVHKYLSFTGADGGEALEQISDVDSGSDVTDEEDNDTHLYVDLKTELPYAQMICDGKKYKRLIDRANGNTYDVSDSDQSLSDDDHPHDHG